MIRTEIKTDTNSENFKILKWMVIGKKIREIELVTGTGYTKNGEKIEIIKIFMENNMVLSISQITEPIDDEDEHETNPLEIEVFQ